MPQEQDNFERAFADLSYAQLKDKAPKLLDYMIGFQVIDKDEDDTHAAGVFGFKIGNQWFYAPTFFLNGEMKGADMLYSKSQDIFVPLQENWVNYIISRKPDSLGEGTPQTESDLGVMNPDFRAYIDSPLRGWHKTSAYCDYDADMVEMREGCWKRGESFDISPVLYALGKSPNSEEYKEAAARLDLAKAMPEIGAKAAAFIAESVRRSPELGTAIAKYYSGKELMPKQAETEAGAISQPTEYELHKASMDRSLFNYHVERLIREGFNKESGSDRAVVGLLSKHGIRSLSDLKDHSDIILQTPAFDHTAKQAASVTPSAEIITRKEIADNPPAGLTDDEREEAMQEGFIVRDTRSDGDKTRVYDINVTDQFSNPDESGLYAILDKNGNSHEVLVVLNPKTIGSGTCEGALVVARDGKTMGEGVRNQIYVRSDVSSGCKALYGEMVDAQDMKVNKSYIVFSGQGSITLPFTVMEKDEKKMMVNVMSPRRLSNTPDPCPYPSSRHISMFDRQCNPRTTHDYPTTCISDEDGIGYHESEADRLKWKKNSVRPVVCTDREGTLKNVGDTLMLPKGCKAFEVDNFPEKLDFLPANLTDIELCYIKKGSLDAIKIWSDGLGYQIGTAGQVGPRMDKIAAVTSLVRDMGVGADSAKMMLNRADTEGEECFHVKKADISFPGGPLTNSAPNGPDPSQLDNDRAYDPTLKVMSNSPSETYAPANLPMSSTDAYDPYNSDPNKPPAYMNQKAIEDAIAASKSGQKDVMDVSVLGSLVKAMDVDPMVNKYTADLIKGEDRLGRILLLYYWHNDKFKERYGDDEMQELESVLKNTFKSMGDLILFLRKRGVQIDVALQGSGVDLRELST